MNTIRYKCLLSLGLLCLATFSAAESIDKKTGITTAPHQPISGTKVTNQVGVTLVAKPYTAPGYVFANYRTSEKIEGPRKLVLYVKHKKIIVKQLYDASSFIENTSLARQEVDVALLQVTPTRQLLLQAILNRNGGNYWQLVDSQSKKTLYQSGNDFWATGELFIDGEGAFVTLQSNALWCGRVWLEQALYSAGKIVVQPISLALLNEESSVSAKSLSVLSDKNGTQIVTTLKQDDTVLVLGEDGTTLSIDDTKPHRFLVKSAKGFIGWVSAQRTLNEFLGCKVQVSPK